MPYGQLHGSDNQNSIPKLRGITAHFPVNKCPEVQNVCNVLGNICLASMDQTNKKKKAANQEE